MMMVGFLSALTGCNPPGVALSCPETLRVGEAGFVDGGAFMVSRFPRYQWTVEPTTAGRFADTTAGSTEFIPSEEGIATVTFQVSDQFWITVDSCDIEVAGQLPAAVDLSAMPSSVTTGGMVTLTCESIGAEDIASFDIMQTSGETVELTPDDANPGVFAFDAPDVAGSLRFECTGTTAGGETSPISSTSVTVTQQSNGGGDGGGNVDEPTVRFDIAALSSPTVQPGETVSYVVTGEVLTVDAASPGTRGLASFELRISTDLGVAQQAATSLDPDVSAAFSSAFPPSLGGPCMTESDDICGIQAVQFTLGGSGVADIGLGGSPDRLIRGALTAPTVPGLYFVRISSNGTAAGLLAANAGDTPPTFDAPVQVGNGFTITVLENGAAPGDQTGGKGTTNQPGGDTTNPFPDTNDPFPDTNDPFPMTGSLL